jgi:formamidopyrimidine-DNA glycosylase
MPELPEVETVRRGLNQLTLNQSFRGGEVLLSRTIAPPFSPEDFLAGLTGGALAQPALCAIAGWSRLGKYLLAELTTGGFLAVHLRMTGQLLWLSAETPVHKHTRVRLFLGDHQELRFVDQRTFGQMWYVPPDIDPKQIITGLQKLGLDALDPLLTAEYLAKKLQSGKRAIKTALLDQALAAGMGNIYADEALFLSGIHPQTPGNQLNLEQLENLRSAMVQVLTKSIEVGGTTFSNFLNVKGINGNYGGEAWVYNREGQECKTCGTKIDRMKLGGRSAHFCPHCQS